MVLLGQYFVEKSRDSSAIPLSRPQAVREFHSLMPRLNPKFPNQNAELIFRPLLKLYYLIRWNFRTDRLWS